jgi:hypothetical protein
MCLSIFMLHLWQKRDIDYILYYRSTCKYEATFNFDLWLQYSPYFTRISSHILTPPLSIQKYLFVQNIGLC